MTVTEILARIESLREDFAYRATSSGSGFIDPSEAQLAGEARQRETFSEITDLLQDLLRDAAA